MALPRNRVFWYAGYVLVRVLSALLQGAGWRAGYALARCAGWALYRLDRRHRRTALANLEASFPAWPAWRREQVARQSMQNLARMGMEVVFGLRAVTAQTWTSRIRLRDMSEPIRLMTQRRSPVILVTCHFGNWEVAGHLAAAIALPTVTIARRLDNPYLDRHIIGLRERAGQEILDKDGAARRASDVLDQRGVLVVVPDQDAGPRGTFVPFFGRPASTVKTVALLAMTHCCPVCVIYSRRLDDDYHFEVGCQRVIRPAEWAAQHDPLRWITAQFTTAFEQVILQAPEQYLWMHNRWKTPPCRLRRAADGTGRWAVCPLPAHG